MMPSHRPEIGQAVKNYTLPPLHPDLLPYLCKDELHHPLVSLDGGVRPSLYSRINKLYQYKQELLSKNDPPNVWQAYYPHLPAFERVHKFTLEELEKLDFPKRNPAYFKLLGQIWTDRELLAQSSSFLELMLNTWHGESPSEYVHHMMTSTEQEKLAALPNEFTVFRGHDDPLLHGISWTLNLAIAFQYAVGNPHKSSVSIGTVQKSEVIAFIDRWNEDEIVVSTKNVHDIETHHISDHWCLLDRTTPWR